MQNAKCFPYHFQKNWQRIVKIKIKLRITKLNNIIKHGTLKIFNINS